MNNFSLLVKPASFKCNLRCQYCFYLEKEDLFKNPKLMTSEVLERMISSFLALPMYNHSFGWQGGEPTLMGLDFFKKVTFFQEKYGNNGMLVSNGLQTNGTLLDDDWCEHLHNYNFLVGISVDGPKHIHDKHRLNAIGEGSHDLVLKGLAALKRHSVEFNILTLVSDSNADYPVEIYEYIKSLGANFHQYIECVEFDSNGNLMPFSVKPHQWGEFLCQIFDQWYKYDRYKISVRLFDSILIKLVDGISNVCSMAQDCRQYFVIEHNGDVYPCDFFVQPELRLGNIMTNDWKDFLDSPVYKKFGERKSELNIKCETCKFLELCAGCCPKNRFGRVGDPRKLSVLCEGWKIFFSHTIDRFKSLAKEIKERRQREELSRKNIRSANFAKRKVGRNDPCPCGSGKKFKKCCGK